MEENNVKLSVIVPTHNRYPSLKVLLEKLCGQTFPAEQFEVIVVADGCTDNTQAFASATFPFAFTLIQQNGLGASAARNRGVDEATGELLLFLDDDILPDSKLIEVHVKAHVHENDVVIGYLPLLLPGQNGLFSMTLRAWWEEKFHQMSIRGHRFNFTDLMSGNFSVSSTFFSAAGGFNPLFLCAEDYELGIRLMRAGARFKYEKRAWGWHNDQVTDLQRSLERKRDEGRAHVAMCRLYPDAIHGLKLGEFSKKRSNRRLNFLLKNTALPDRFLRSAVSLAVWYDKKRFRNHWKRLNYVLHDYSYYRGAMEFFSSPEGLKDFVVQTKASLALPALSVDMQQGVTAAFHQVDAMHPESLLVKFGSYTIGKIPWAYGERLEAVHLKQFLCTTLKERYLKALAFDHDFMDTLFHERTTNQKQEEEAVHV